MTPDELHEEGVKSGRIKLHTMMAPETRAEIDGLRERIKIHEDTDSKIQEEMKSKIKEISNELENKVSFKLFSWVLGILMTIVIGLLGLIYVKVEDTAKTTYATNQNVSLIQWRLDNAEITK